MLLNHERLAQLRDVYQTSLLHDVIPFWQRYGVDRECGGFLTYLDRDGRVYCTDKPIWLQGRAIWLFATLHQMVEPRPEWLNLATHGCEFLLRHCFSTGSPNKMHFLVTRDGKPLRTRRHVYSEVFGVLALAAMTRATGDAGIARHAAGLFDSLVTSLTTEGAIEPKINPRARPMKALAPLMCLVSVAGALRDIGDADKCERVIDQALDEILRDFVKPDDDCVLEVVGPDGEHVEGPDGRVMNPGHTIEAAWFIMEIGRRRGNQRIIQQAARMLDIGFARGWDTEHGGLLYFIDVGGKPPAQLEHDMKLWWPHCEALYATLLAYRVLGDERYARMFEQVHEYAFAHFPDPRHGEWFGYLRRDGARSLNLKGNLWKGPFHVPRALMLCWKLLDAMAEGENRGNR
ncbi:MAG: AGE family epimerase/isomerase [Phycisphaerae bacterium]|nr:AGE family epimerase/isomerase [Phycisphaerae bacterium]